VKAFIAMLMVGFPYLTRHHVTRLEPV
jgi:hypothetical protein